MRKWLIYFLGGVPNEHLEKMEVKPVVSAKAGLSGLKLFRIKKPKIRSLKSKTIFCPVIDKVSYVEPIAKSRAAEHKTYMRAYKCEFCAYWHLTHHKNYL